MDYKDVTTLTHRGGSVCQERFGGFAMEDVEEQNGVDAACRQPEPALHNVALFACDVP